VVIIILKSNIVGMPALLVKKLSEWIGLEGQRSSTSARIIHRREDSKQIVCVLFIRDTATITF